MAEDAGSGGGDVIASISKEEDIADFFASLAAQKTNV